MLIHCPNCNSTRLKIVTRKSYLLIAFLYLIAAAVLFVLSQFTPGLNHYAGLLLASVAVIAVLAFVLYLIFAAMQLSPTYRCKTCAYQFWERS